MIINSTEFVEILEYEKTIGIDLVVNERVNMPRLPRYYCSFESHLFVRDGVTLIGISGNGDTVDLAIRDYCKKLSLKPIAIRPFEKEKIEYTIAPNLMHTKNIF